MLTRVQQHALDRFAKSLVTLADDSLIDAYHQAWEDHRDAGAEDSDNLGKACAESLATRKAMQVNQLVLHSPAPVVPALAAAAAGGERVGTRFLEFAVIICASEGRGST